MIKLKKKNNKNKSIATVIILTIAIAFVIFFIWNNWFKEQGGANNYEAERTSTEGNSEEENKEENKDEENNGGEETATPSIEPPPSPSVAPPVEEPLSSFSTPVINKETARQNNINITCQALDGTIVANGTTFSFCNTVGPATTEKGYQKADIFDKKGNKKKGLGGGNCQISSTLYNAVLAVPGLNISERHAHSNKVPYIQTGKDAAVAYGSYDFKFVNQTGADIKILCSSDGNTVNISIVKLVPQS